MAHLTPDDGQRVRCRIAGRIAAGRGLSRFSALLLSGHRKRSIRAISYFAMFRA